MDANAHTLFINFQLNQNAIKSVVVQSQQMEKRARPELMILTVSEGVESPLIIFEESVSFDFLHAISAQTHLPQNKQNINLKYFNQHV